eukprot:GHVS01094960.1.p1 GENE.GHVS01094960.1~~GHVS01094960.1.p1  ORF type:complete len:234 (-),score=49.28 GHVS01094960.1:198-899(-)
MEYEQTLHHDFLQLPPPCCTYSPPLRIPSWGRQQFSANSAGHLESSFPFFHFSSTKPSDIPCSTFSVFSPFTLSSSSISYNNSFICYLVVVMFVIAQLFYLYHVTAVGRCNSISGGGCGGIQTIAEDAAGSRRRRDSSRAVLGISRHNRNTVIQVMLTFLLSCLFWSFVVVMPTNTTSSSRHATITTTGRYATTFPSTSAITTGFGHLKGDVLLTEKMILLTVLTLATLIVSP